MNMTSEQQAALEKLAGRALSEDEVAAIEPLLLIRNDVAIADIISVGRTKTQDAQVGIDTILTTMKPNGGAFLDAIAELGKTNRDVYWGMDIIQRGVFNPGLAGARAFLNDLKVALPQFADDLDKIKMLADQPDPIHYNEVSNALNKAEGRETLV